MNIYILEPCSSVIKGFKKLFEAEGVNFVEDANTANVIISSSKKTLLEFNSPPGCKNILWINEARWSSDIEGVLDLPSKKIHVMNCYTDNIFVDIFHYLWVCNYKKIEHLTSDDYERRKNFNAKPSYFMASNHGDGKPFYIRNVNIDLYQLRDSFSLKGFELGVTDIYGQGWPEGIAIQEDRTGQDWKSWEQRKLAIAEKYFFTICIENTHYKNLVTEKWWHSIMTKTVPIYYVGNTGIDKYFDIHAVIDVASFKNHDEVFEAMQNISKSEYIDRVNTLIDNYNSVATNPEVLANSRKTICSKVIETIYS